MKTIFRAALAGTCLAGVALLGACDRPNPKAEQNYALSGEALPPLPASLPLEPGPPTPLIAAPAVERLPAAPRPALRRLVDDYDDYAYLDRAALYDDVFFDAPPDYAFDYDGVSPWGWEGYDGAIAYAEPLDVGYRYYYYEPGYETPYLVRDPYYSYAFDGPALVVIYDHFGHVLPRSDYGQRWDYAGRYFARGRDLRAAAARDRRGAVAADWATRRLQFAAASSALDAARAREPAWTAYHDRTGDRQGTRWRTERRARAEAARQFNAFERSGFQQPRTDFADYARRDRDRPQYIVAPNGRPDRSNDRVRLNRRFDERQRADTAPVFARAPQDRQREQAGRDRFARSQRIDAQGEQQRLEERRGQQRFDRQQQAYAQRAQRQQQMQAERIEQRAQQQEQMQAQRQEQQVQRQQRMQAQRDQSRVQRQQQVQTERVQQRAQRQQQMQAERLQQQAQRQQQMQAQRDQWRAQRQQQVQAERVQQRAQRQQQMQAERQQQQAQRQQQMQAQRDQSRAQRQQQVQVQRQENRQAQNQALSQPGSGRGHGHGNGRD